MGVWAKLFANPYHHSISPEYTTRLFTSWLLPPRILFAYRALISLYAFIVLFFILGYQSTHGDSQAAGESFSFFTVLTFWGLAFYFAFAAAHTASYAWTGRPWLERWPSVLRWAHGVYYGTVTVYPFIVTVVFWIVLSRGAYKSTFSTWSNISEHAINSLFAGLEIILPRSDPHPSINIMPMIVILACYLGLAYLTYDTQGFYVYGFLDPSIGRGLVAGACIGILAATIIVFFIVSGLIWVRRWVTEKKLGMTGKFPSRAPMAVGGSVTSPTVEGTEMWSGKSTPAF